MSQPLFDLAQILNAAGVNGSRTIQPTFMDDINIGLYWIGVASFAVAILAWMIACCASKKQSYTNNAYGAKPPNQPTNNLHPDPHPDFTITLPLCRTRL